jgi:hypothetical protein
MRRAVALLFVAAAAAGVAVFAGSGAAVDPAPAPGRYAPPQSTFSVAAARAFAEFPVYNVGNRFRDLPLVAVLRRADAAAEAGEPVAADYVSFVYGDCEPRAGGCAPPLEVQVWPACVRNPSVLSYVGLGTPEATTVRGVPATFLDEGPGAARLELTTGRATVVVFGSSREQVTEAALALRGVNRELAADRPLPAPANGALAGRLDC